MHYEELSGVSIAHSYAWNARCLGYAQGFEGDLGRTKS
jgi:hypothetical protein